MSNVKKESFALDVENYGKCETDIIVVSSGL